MSKIENENVDMQVAETAIEEIKPEGFFTKAGRWVAEHKVAVAVTAAAGAALAFVVGAIVKNAKEDQTDMDEELVDTDEFDYLAEDSDE